MKARRQLSIVVALISFAFGCTGIITHTLGPLLFANVLIWVAIALLG